MLIGTPLGFNPFSSIASGVKAAAKGVYSVASDSRVQRAATSAAQAYAPAQYAQATAYADRARGLIRPPGQPMSPPQMMPPPMPPPGPMMDDDAGPAMAPVKKGNLIPLVMIGGAAVLVLLLLKK